MHEEQNIEDQNYQGLTAASVAATNERAVLDSESRQLDAKLPGTLGSGTASVVNNGIVVPAATPDQQTAPLFSSGEMKEFRIRWDSLQGGFVDEPRLAVEHADNLVSEAMKRLAEMFSTERTKLEGQWDRKESVSTEDLRLALRRYHSFFDRILAA